MVQSFHDAWQCHYEFHDVFLILKEIFPTFLCTSFPVLSQRLRWYLYDALFVVVIRCVFTKWKTFVLASTFVLSIRGRRLRIKTRQMFQSIEWILTTSATCHGNQQWAWHWCHCIEHIRTCIILFSTSTCSTHLYVKTAIISLFKSSSCRF